MNGRRRQIRFGLWKEVSASASSDGDAREARIAYANSKLGTSDLRSWSEMSDAQARRLANAMRKDLGRRRSRDDEPVSPQALETIGNLAIELYGAERWHDALMDRLKRRPYRYYGPLDKITARQSHSLIEELLDYVERRQNPQDSTMKERRERKELARGRNTRT